MSSLPLDRTKCCEQVRERRKTAKERNYELYLMEFLYTEIYDQSCSLNQSTI